MMLRATLEPAEYDEKKNPRSGTGVRGTKLTYAVGCFVSPFDCGAAAASAASFVPMTVSIGALSSLFKRLSISSSVFVASAKLESPSCGHYALRFASF
jgi:hypothetical protein